MNTAAITVVIVAIAVIVIIGFAVYFRKERTRRLRAKFGPEYDRVVGQQRGDPTRAEAMLEKRLKRTREFHIRPLSPEETSRFAAEWRSIQELFVDDPRAALSLADTLVNEALGTRGYPTGDFEQRATDISVEHPQTVEDYRIAHDIAAHGSRNEASTEDLRVAMQHYRSVFEDILQIHITRREEVHR